MIDPGTGQAIPDLGTEFIISARASEPFDFNLDDAEAKIQAAVAEVVQAIEQNTIWKMCMQGAIKHN